MRITRLSVATALAFTLGTLAQARADQVPGKNGNCAATWFTGTAAATVGVKSSTLLCTDGDATCDADGIPNGVCNIVLNACVGQVSGSCPAPAALTNLKFNAQITKKQIVSGFVPPGAPPSCGTAGTLVVPLKRVPKKRTKPLKRYNPSNKVVLLMKAKKFRNKLVVQCAPPTGTTNCPLRTDNASFPAQLTLKTPATGSDLDNGWTGASHNFPIVNGSTLKYCLSNCDGTSDTLCDGAGATGEGSLNGPQFGAPLPLLTANVPVCVISRYQTSPITTIYDLATGQGAADVDLFTDVYLTNDPTEVGSCIPAASRLTATLDIKLRLTTGEASLSTVPLPCGDSAGPQLQSDDCGTGTCTEGACTGTACLSGSGTNCVDAKGGISQACCSNKTSTPCFTNPITRSGKPATSGSTGAFAATYCIARTNSTLINTVVGLPGPGATILPIEVAVTP